MTSIHINERPPFSLAKSTKDSATATATATATKKKKFVGLVVFFSGVGLVGFSATQYSYSSDGGGGGGIRASTAIEGNFLSVDSRSSGSSPDGTCVPSSGTWSGKSFNGDGSSPFETCYKYAPTGEECWSKSYFDNPYLDVDAWHECQPTPYNGETDDVWNFLNSGAASNTCGSPCQDFVSTADKIID